MELIVFSVVKLKIKIRNHSLKVNVRKIIFKKGLKVNRKCRKQI